MPRIYVDFQKFKEFGNRCASISVKVDNIRVDFSDTVKRLDWDFKVQYDINKRAEVISRQLEDYRKILKSYREFIDIAYEQYVKLERDDSLKIEKNDFFKSEEDNALKKWAKDFFSLGSVASTFSGVGSVGDFLSIFSSLRDAIFGFNDGNIARGTLETGKSGFYLAKIIDSISQHKKIFEAMAGTIGAKSAAADWIKDALGYQVPSGISNSKNFLENLKENLKNVDSPFNWENMLNDYKWNGGIDPTKSVIANPATATVDEIKEAAKVANQLEQAHKTFAFSVGEAVFSGATHLVDNIEEMKNSDGEMSATRVGAETVLETMVDFGLNKASYMLIGAGVTSALVVAGAPIAAGFLVGTLASGLVVTALDTGVKALSGQSIAEWVSDGIIDGSKTIAKAIGDNVKSTTESFANWFGKLAQAPVIE